jgi:hypothetical protein
MIRLKCINENCEFTYEVTESELQNNPQYHKSCMMCGSLLQVDNLSEIVEMEVTKQVKENIDKWVKQYGWDYVIDLVKKYKDDYAVGRLYVEELSRRGFKLKEKE